MACPDSLRWRLERFMIFLATPHQFVLQRLQDLPSTVAKTNAKTV